MSRLIALILFVSSAGFAVTLSTGIRPSEVDTLVSELGPAAATRILRSAESYPKWPGLKIGIEVLAIPTRDLVSVGNRDGSAPGVIPAPRLYLAKGLGADFELILNGMLEMQNSIATWGAGLKWNAQSEEETWVAIAGYLAYTRVDGFNASYVGNDVEFGAIISKDYVRLKPFFGVGALVAQGEVSQYLAASGQRSSWQPTLHISAGAEIELPVNFTLQLDLMNLHPMGSVLVSKKF